jgi:nitrite reductase/ring-hydroxylating ferredoxin subunit
VDEKGGDVLQDDTTRAREMSRRDFFQWAAGLSIGATCALGAVTAASAVNPPGRSIDGKTKMGPTALVAVKDLLPDKPRLFEYGDDSVFITKLAGDKIVALNAACPHVKCILHWDEKLGEYACPCHASFFKPDGARISGPAPRGMDPAIFAVQNGQVVVSGFGTGA